MEANSQDSKLPRNTAKRGCVANDASPSLHEDLLGHAPAGLLGELPNGPPGDLAGCNDAFGVPTLPCRHLSAIVGVSVAVGIVYLVGGWAWFQRCIDIENRVPRRAEYRVDVNTERWVEFANLPSIGEKTAKSIVMHRSDIGRYHWVDQLLEVKGVGEKTFAKIQRHLSSASSGMSAEQSGLPKPPVPNAD